MDIINKIISNYKNHKDYRKAYALWLFYYQQTEEYDNKLNAISDIKYNNESRSTFSQVVYNNIVRIAERCNILNKMNEVKNEVDSLSKVERTKAIKEYDKYGYMDFIHKGTLKGL